MSDLRSLRVLLFAGVAATAPLPAQDGEALFTLHCAACHLPDRQLVGPSLVEVRKLYLDKEAEFLAWCREPQQKRQGVIQMPPMVHVGDENLKAIHAYIVDAAKDLKEVKVKGQDPFYAAPSMRKRPQVQRLFMPEAGPAAIAVAVNDDLHYCWDAGECRLRYVWKGDFIDGWPVWRGNGNGLAKIQGEIIHREEHNPVPYLDLVDSRLPTPKFLGYRLVDGLPVFRWSVLGFEVCESIRPTPDGRSLVRTFEFPGRKFPFDLRFSPSEKMSVSSTTVPVDAEGRATVTLTPKS